MKKEFKFEDIGIVVKVCQLDEVLKVVKSQKEREQLRDLDIPTYVEGTKEKRNLILYVRDDVKGGIALEMIDSCVEVDLMEAGVSKEQARKVWRKIQPEVRPL